MQKLKRLINDLESKVLHHEKVSSSVSTASVGWHVSHSLLVITQIVSRLKKSDPLLYKYKFNLSKTYVYVLGRIPRGRGKAPEIVIPKGEINEATIAEQLAIVDDAITNLSNLDRNSYIEHPYFGQLNLKHTQTFLMLHTVHHLKIIQDILKKSNSQ